MAKVRVVMLGCGGIAAKHVKASPDMEWVGLCDVTEKQLENFKKRCWPEGNAPPCYTDAAKMYKETKPDAVVVCTPHTLHYEQAVQALKAGCHVLMEKPMVTCLKHAVDLEKKVKKSGKVFCIAYNTPCCIEFKKLRDLCRSGEFGKLKVVNIHISQDWYRFTKGLWRQDPALSGGGMIYDSGAHVMNSLVWTVESDVDVVHAFVDNLDCPVDINGTVNVRFKNGVMACVAVSGEGPSGAHGAWMFERGKVEIDPWGGSWIKIFDGRGLVKYPVMEGQDSNPMANFVDAILGRAEARTCPRNGVLQSQLMDAVYESARTGQVARPPKA